MKLIDKDALVAEIKRRKEINKYRDTNDSLFEDEAILSFLNSLEVKEVDLKKEMSNFIATYYKDAKIGHKLSIRRTAKHFFELGLKVKSMFGNNDSNPSYKEALKFIEDHTQVRYSEGRDAEGFRRGLDMEKEYYVEQYFAKKAIEIAMGYKI